MSRMTCLIMTSGCSALSISSFKFARISVETLSSNAITPPQSFRLASSVTSYKRPRLQETCTQKLGLRIQIPCFDTAALHAAVTRLGGTDHHADGQPHTEPENPATSQQAGDDSEHPAQHQSNQRKLFHDFVPLPQFVLEAPAGWLRFP